MSQPSDLILPRELGDNLVLRRGSSQDADTLGEFNERLHMSRNATEPDRAIGIWTRDLLRGTHPTVRPEDFLIVEDTRSGAVVSTSCLIGQQWSYSGIRVGVGRPELVATHVDYRRRGLVREQFEVLHAWSRERGDSMQVITGIPFYYRQFGYEMAIDIGGGGVVFRQNVPGLKAETAEPYRVRLAADADIAAIAELYTRGRDRVLVFAERDAAMWRFLLSGASPRSLAEVVVRVIESPGGELLGFVAHGSILYGTVLPVFCCELRPGTAWLAVAPALLRALLAAGDEIAPVERKELAGIRFGIEPQHPLLESLRRQLQPHPPYALYVRVPDLPAFVRHIAPVLEQRLPGTAGEGYTGELKLSFYRSGLRLRLETGRLAETSLWHPEDSEDGDAAFPNLTFLQLLFGYRSLAELHGAFPDCFARNGNAQALLQALFPKQPSQVWAVN